MPRYNSQNLAALNPEFRKAHNISSGGGAKKSRYAYGQRNNVLVAAGDAIKNGMCLRLLPLYDSADQASRKLVTTFREGAETYGDWCRLVTCAHWVGNPGLCFIVHDGNPDLNLYESPLHVLRKVAWNNRETPGIGRLFTELLSNTFTRDSHVGSLKKPEETLFISASSVFINEQNEITLGAFTDSRDHNARIIGLKKTAAQSFLSALSVRDEDGQFAVRDMLAESGAPLVTFLPLSYMSGGQNLVGHSVSGPATFQCPKFVRTANKAAQFVVGYPQSRTDNSHFAIIHDTYMEQEVSYAPYMESLANDSLSWDEYLFTPSYEEQAEMLAKVFPREALEFAWQEFPEYMRTIPRGTVSVSMLDETEDADEDSVENAAPAPQVRRPVVAQNVSTTARVAKPSGVAEAQAVAAEISAEAAESVAGLFNAAEIPAAMTPSAVVPPATKKPTVPTLNANDVLARARAKAK
jgi:hypothetical protein